MDRLLRDILLSQLGTKLWPDREDGLGGRIGGLNGQGGGRRDGGSRMTVQSIAHASSLRLMS